MTQQASLRKSPDALDQAVSDLTYKLQTSACLSLEQQLHLVEQRDLQAWKRERKAALFSQQRDAVATTDLKTPLMPGKVSAMPTAAEHKVGRKVHNEAPFMLGRRRGSQDGRDTSRGAGS